MPLNFFILYRKKIRRYKVSQIVLHRHLLYMKPIVVKYCGGCNPLIDRPGLVREIEKLLHPDVQLITDMTSSPWEIGILVCGCPIACVDRSDIRDISKRWIRVGGATVDLDSLHEDSMAASIVEKIRMFLA